MRGRRTLLVCRVPAASLFRIAGRRGRRAQLLAPGTRKAIKTIDAASKLIGASFVISAQTTVRSMRMYAMAGLVAQRVALNGILARPSWVLLFSDAGGETLLNDYKRQRWFKTGGQPASFSCRFPSVVSEICRFSSVFSRTRRRGKRGRAA